jgi:hypothetical protein
LFLSFLPAELFLKETEEGVFVVSMRDEELLRTGSSAKAVAKFNDVRRQLESKYPAGELTAQEKAELFQKHLSETILQQSTYRPRKKLKPGSTRTFG